jgi:hypothetical protein
MPASLVQARDRTRARRALRIPGRIRTQAWVSRACLPPPAAGPPSLARGFSVSCAGPRGCRPARHGRAPAAPVRLSMPVWADAGVGRRRAVSRGVGAVQPRVHEHPGQPESSDRARPEARDGSVRARVRGRAVRGHGRDADSGRQGGACHDGTTLGDFASV